MERPGSNLGERILAIWGRISRRRPVDVECFGDPDPMAFFTVTFYYNESPGA